MSNILLDKGVIRKLIEALVNASLEVQLTTEQDQVSNAFRHIVLNDVPFITIETHNILRTKFIHLPFYDLLNELINVIIPVRYTRRWARRLRFFGFSREDAWQIAMATFCSDKIVEDRLVQIDKFLTLDKRLAERFASNFSEIKDKFTKMVSQLHLPFASSQLPQVFTIEEFYLNLDNNL